MVKSIILLTIILSPFFFISCKKEVQKDVVVNNLTASEESKQVVMKTANDLSLELNDLQKEEGLKYLSQALNFIDLSNVSTTLEKSSFFISNLTSLSNVYNSDEKLSKGVYYNSKSYNEEVLNLESIKGIYIWNFSNKDWDVVKSNKIEFHFPLLENVNKNNGVLKIDLNHSKGNNILPDQSVPNSIIAELMFESKSVLTYEMTINYGSTGVPVYILNELRTNFYSIGNEYDFSTGFFSVSQYIKHNSNKIISTSIEIKGNFGENEAYQIIQDYDNFDLQNVSKDVSSIIYNLQILNIEASFMLDNYKFNQVENLDLENLDINILNDLLSVKVVNMKNNSLLANTEFFDNNGEVNLRMVFFDGSKISLESYFNEISNDIESFYESFSESINL